MDIKVLQEFFIKEGFQYGIKILGAIIIYLIGRWLISFAVGLLSKSLNFQKVDQTIIRYVGNIVSVTANIALVIAILGYFGVETTSFAALFAAAGIAIGAAWSGLLANFAAGAFIIVLAPYKVGDFITAGGVTGTVKEIGLFVTTIETPDNVMTFVGNNKIFADNIQNFSTNAYRRVELTAQLNGSVDHNDAIARLKDGLSKIPNVLADPAPSVEILDFNFAGPVLAVRPFTNNTNYWQVYFDTNRLIRESFGAAGYPAPAPQYAIRNVN
jgi:small conductance mechanosensitive channel